MTENVKNQTCKDCRFYDQTQSLNGYCRKLPPTISDTVSFGVWPMVLKRDWCGSFESKQSNEGEKQ
jgi:hypothetical protein